MLVFVCLLEKKISLQNILSARTDKCVNQVTWLIPSGVDLQQVLAEHQHNTAQYLI